MKRLVDTYGRQIDYLRISITDRCNLRCLYCSPLDGRLRFSQAEILSFEEIMRVVEAAVNVGISKIRVTGGEPLVRQGVVDLCRMIAGFPGIRSLGFIAPVTRHFCKACNRLRLTVDGKLRTCLFARKEIDIKRVIRSGASRETLAEILQEAVASKPRGHRLNDQNAGWAPGRLMRAIGG